MPGKTTDTDAPVVIKKYANRRLYNTATSSYVTLEHLCEMVKEDTDFVVHDARTGDDITRPVLTQIIVEQEGKGENLLPIGFLRQLISLYGDNLAGFVPSYLEQSMDSFVRNQEQIRTHLENTMGGVFPFDQLEEIGRTNVAMVERAMDMFAPFGGARGDGGNTSGGARGDGGNTSGGGESELAELKSKIEAMQRQLAAIAKRASKL